VTASACMHARLDGLSLCKQSNICTIHILQNTAAAGMGMGWQFYSEARHNCQPTDGRTDTRINTLSVRTLVLLVS